MRDKFSIQDWRMNLLTEGVITPGESLYIDFHDGSIDEITTDKDMSKLVQRAKQTMQALADQDNEDFPGEANTKVIENLKQGRYVAALSSDMDTLPTACVVISPKYRDYKTMVDLASNNIHDSDLADMISDIVADVMPEGLDEVENEMPIGNREVPLGASLQSMFPQVDKGEMDNDFFIDLFDALGDYFVANAEQLTNMDAKEIANHCKLASRAIRGRSSN